MDELGALEQRRQHGPEGAIELVRALGPAGEVDDGLGRLEPQEPAAGLPRAAGQLRPQRVAGDHRALGGDIAAGERKGERHAAGEAGGHAVGEPGHGRLLVDDHGDAEHARGQRRREGDEAPGGEEEAGLEPSQEAPGLGEARGDAQAQIGHVLPVPVAAELARRDGVKGQPGLGSAPGLHAATAADPVHLHPAPHQRRRHREARARVPTRAAARDDDAHAPGIIRRGRAHCRAHVGRARSVRARRQRRSRASSIRRAMRAG